MDKSLEKIHEHMLELGLGSLSHANYLANFYDMKNMMWNQLGVLQAAHACEIFLKARLAQEHPLLIFESLPKSTAACIGGNGLLDFESLLEKGQTINYASLPEKVWAATGLKIKNIDLYNEFGRLRNSIQHFASPHNDVTDKTINFIYRVIDPFIYECWGLCAIDYCDDSEPYENMVSTLIENEVEFNISKQYADYTKETHSDYSSTIKHTSNEYRILMNSRIESAKDS